jgi:N-methylhydantoinase B
MEEIKNYSERRIRSEIAKLPQGTYEAEDFLDDDGIKDEPIKLKVAVSIMGDTFVADFTGSDKQVEGPINATYGVASSQTYNAVFNLTDHTIPSNHGCFRAIKVIAPGGTIVNADHPAATFGGNVETSGRIVDVIMAAMSKAVPEKVAAGCYGTCHNCTGGGTDPRSNNDPFCWYLFREGGWGARATKDGNDALMDYVGNDMNQPIEVLENTYPWLIEKYELVNDSMGPGKFRGGMGTCYTIKFLNEDTRLNIITDKCNQSPFGLLGGLPPIPREECGHYNDIRVKMNENSEFKHITEVFGAVSASKAASMKMPKGSVVELMTYGGGGYGSPLERDPERVQRDVIQGKTSLKNARIYYGVVLDPESLEIDEAETNNLRKEMLKGGKKSVK